MTSSPICQCGQTTATAIKSALHGITAPFPSCMDCDSADKPVRSPFVLSPPPARDFPAAVEPQASAAGVFSSEIARGWRALLPSLHTTSANNSQPSSARA